jgi:uncharacterized 2Fe-2S/4Fe-4S cluster protein (DUF4445 family)
MSSRHLILFPDAAHPLADLLLAEGVEFPCGGEGSCGECRVRVMEGEVSVTPAMRDHLSDGELRAGWRLGCCLSSECALSGPVRLEVRQWQTVVLSDDAPLSTGPLSLTPREGYGVAVDLGTTTVVVQCVDLRTGEIVSTQSALNGQARYGADVMSRVQHALAYPGVLTGQIRQQIGTMLDAAAETREIREVLIAGNTVMHHLFCGCDLTPLASAPFRSPSLGAITRTGEELGWSGHRRTPVTFLPCLGGFVGSDVLAGMIACGLGAGRETEALMDLGTNGEIALADGEEIVCASTAAGPAFEGGRISRGMRAGPGAIHQVDWRDGVFHCHVIGGGDPCGICGSGLLDAVAAALDSGQIEPSGKLRSPGQGVALTGGLALTQRDIREMQLAKGAIASGLALLSKEMGASAVQLLHLAGAFGNYARERSARRIGLLPPHAARGPAAPTVEKVHPAGNAALRGTRMLLLQAEGRDARLANLTQRTRHVELAALPGFEDAFVNALEFPEPEAP